MDALNSSDAEDLLEIVSSRARDFSRKAAEDLYAHLLEATQDYLIDNARFNIGEKIRAANHQARRDREERFKAEARINAMMHLMRRIALLNPEAGEIGAGMLAQIVAEARRFAPLQEAQ